MGRRGVGCSSAIADPPSPRVSPLQNTAVRPPHVGEARGRAYRRDGGRESVHGVLAEERRFVRVGLAASEGRGKGKTEALWSFRRCWL
jgi:hypothetical protein